MEQTVLILLGPLPADKSSLASPTVRRTRATRRSEQGRNEASLVPTAARILTLFMPLSHLMFLAASVARTLNLCRPTFSRSAGPRRGAALVGLCSGVLHWKLFSPPGWELNSNVALSFD